MTKPEPTPAELLALLTETAKALAEVKEDEALLIKTRNTLIKTLVNEHDVAVTIVTVITGMSRQGVHYVLRQDA